MDIQSLGRLMLFAGVAIAITGAAFLLIGRFTGGEGLPLDIQIKGQNFSCFVPIGTMIVISIMLSIVLNILIRLFNR